MAHALALAIIVFIQERLTWLSDYQASPVYTESIFMTFVVTGIYTETPLNRRVLNGVDIQQVAISLYTSIRHD